MRLALVTTPPSLPSGIGDYTRRLLPHLVEHAEVEVYVAPGLEGELLCGLPTRSIDSLRPREVDQVLYQLGNERQHAFMAPLVRALGGTVVLHDWVLFDMAVAAYPGLERASWQGLSTALREGGLGQARVWWRNRMQRRLQRRVPLELLPELDELEGTFLWGWYEPESGGRWIADAAQLRPPADTLGRLRLVLNVPARRGLRILQGGVRLLERELEPGADLELELPLGREPGAPLHFEVGALVVSAAQRRAGDVRRLGLFVKRVAFESDSGWRELDLSERAAAPLRPTTLARDRFELPLNRSVVRFADAFLVHSEFVAERVRTDRNAPTPIGVVPHGAHAQWRPGDRRLERDALGLDPAWRDAFLVTSFGALQTHKRIDVLLEAVASARRSRPQLRLVLLGAEQPAEFDVRGLIARLGLEGAVQLAGRLDESEVLRWVHAADLAVQLRGPSTGGTSGGLFQTLSMGRGVIASALDEQRELPDECVYKLHPGDGEAERLAQKLVDLCDAPAVRSAMEQAARDFVERECRWDRVAARYIEYLEGFPCARAARKTLWAMRLEKAGREGYARGKAGS